MTKHNATISPAVLISKAKGLSLDSGTAQRTIVRETTPSPVPLTDKTRKQHKPNARDRRAARDKLARLQRQRDHFADATAFAYFNSWPLEWRITITWDACLYGDQNEGHILGLHDRERNERLRNELARVLRKEGFQLVCIWARDEGGKLGLHVHLGLYWPLSEIELVQLLTRLTGSPPSQARLPSEVVAQSECRGWQIKRNMARDELRSAMTWTTYLRDQGQRHLIVPRIPGKVLGVSRSLGLGAVEAEKEALEAWKNRVGWSELEAAERA